MAQEKNSSTVHAWLECFTILNLGESETCAIGVLIFYEKCCLISDGKTKANILGYFLFLYWYLRQKVIIVIAVKYN